MTTTQQPRSGRHARPDEPSRDVSPVPPQRPSPEDADAEPGFGEWPYGSARKPEAPIGPNPYLPSDEASLDGPAPEVRLAPGGWPGTVALLAGVVGAGLATIPVVALVVWPLSLLGLILGVTGLRRARSGAARNATAAVAGTLLCAAGLVLSIGWTSMFVTAGVGTADPVVEPPAIVTR